MGTYLMGQANWKKDVSLDDEQNDLILLCT